MLGLRLLGGIGQGSTWAKVKGDVARGQACQREVARVDGLAGVVEGVRGGGPVRERRLWNCLVERGEGDGPERGEVKQRRRVPATRNSSRWRRWRCENRMVRDS